MSKLPALSLIESTVSIRRFNKGEANQIFDEVKSSGTKVVLEHDHPVCVLISPEKYEALVKLLSDFALL